MKKQYTIQLFFFFILFMLATACEQLFIAPDGENTPRSNFETLWNETKNRYSFFELKGVDWDSVYNIYSPKISNEMDEKALFLVLSSMLNELRDGHVNLSSNFDRGRNWDWYLNFETNFNIYNIEENYLGRDYRITGPFRNQVIDSVLYVYYGSFSDNFSDKILEELMLRADGLKGVIVDVRKNGGGSLNNAERIASLFTADTVVYARERYKNGYGINDFSEWIDMTIVPHSGKQFLGNVVVLCNRSSYSASSFFSQMMTTLPNVTLMGDQTGGGGGIPASGELPNGWRYRFSVSQTVTPLGDHIEPGVPVDRVVYISRDDEHRGIDTVIDSALVLLNSK